MKPLEEQAKQFFGDEERSNQVYQYLAQREKNPQHHQELLRFARMEKEHAAFWEEVLKKRGKSVSPPKTFFIKWLFSFLKLFLGYRFVNRVMEVAENKTIKKYYLLADHPGLTEEEQQRLREIIQDEILHETYFGETREGIEENIRDIFLGLNDGLVEILCAVAGFSGLYNESRWIALSGLVVGLSGTLSMAIGTYISVKNQKDVKEMGFFRMRVLKELFQTGTLPPPPGEHPLRAGVLTGMFYLLATFIIIFPFFILSQPLVSLGISVLFAILVWGVSGIIIALSSGLTLGKKIGEMLLTGLGAAAITYTFGDLLNRFIKG